MSAPPKAAPGRSPGVALLALLAALLACAIALPARADPRSEFFTRMLGDPDARVRTSAALRLSELRARDSVDAILSALAREPNAAARGALLAALSAIGEPRALPDVSRFLRDPSAAVRLQAQRAVAALRAAGRASEPSPTDAPPRFVVIAGVFSNSSQVREAEVGALALRFLGEALAHSPGVAPQGAHASGGRRLPGFVIDGNVGALEPRGAGVRAAVSLVVQTHPGRVYQFESTAAATVPVASLESAEARVQAEDSAVRHAVESALRRALEQLPPGR